MRDLRNLCTFRKHAPRRRLERSTRSHYMHTRAARELSRDLTMATGSASIFRPFRGSSFSRHLRAVRAQHNGGKHAPNMIMGVC
jgi:hypothetical protein